MNKIIAENIPEAYAEAIFSIRTWGEKEDSRNGPVITVPDPCYLEVMRPKERVLTDPIRDANPFFHVMEFVWMMAGENNVQWIAQFNKRFIDYADPGTNIIHASYGHRWLKHFGRNQIAIVAGMLSHDRSTRRAVMGMWDPRVDLEPHNDLPCNTTVMFRWNTLGKQLDMTVINRSNDVIWGMLGANAVHMTYMFELVCHEAGLPMGRYRVFTNNLHIYTQMPRFEEIWKTYEKFNIYLDVDTYPLMQPREHQTDLVIDCMDLVDGTPGWRPRTQWMKNVAQPMYMAWKYRKDGKDNLCDHILKDHVAAQDWRIACQEWVERRNQAKEQGK